MVPLCNLPLLKVVIPAYAGTQRRLLFFYSTFNFASLIACPILA